MNRGRPALDGQTWECHIHLRLRAGDDDDLIAFLSNIPTRKRAAVLKSALRNGGVSLSQAEAGIPEDEFLETLDDFLK
jgi:hypothetical protein